MNHGEFEHQGAQKYYLWRNNIFYKYIIIYNIIYII